MTSGRSLVDGDCDWSPLFRPVDLSLLRISVPGSLLSMAAQEVMKHYTILEELCEIEEILTGLETGIWSQS